MLHASYELWRGIAGLLNEFWTITRTILKSDPQRGCTSHDSKSNASCRDHDIEHRALIFLMSRKTDSMLAALAQTIEQERQKLGVVVRKPSMGHSLDAFPTAAMEVSDDCRSSYEQISPMVREGISMPKIARQLELPEAEVSMVMRLNAL